MLKLAQNGFLSQNDLSIRQHHLVMKTTCRPVRVPLPSNIDLPLAKQLEKVEEQCTNKKAALTNADLFKSSLIDSLSFKFREHKIFKNISISI